MPHLRDFEQYNRDVGPAFQNPADSLPPSTYVEPSERSTCEIGNASNERFRALVGDPGIADFHLCSYPDLRDAAHEAFVEYNQSSRACRARVELIPFSKKLHEDFK